METTNNFKILLVDDDPFCLGMYQQHLESLGYSDITSFDNGPDCLNHLTLQPDVIILDHGMETLNGLEVLKKIKRFNPNIYVIFVSGQENIETAVSALKFGAFDYIVKGKLQLENLTKVLGKIKEISDLFKIESPAFINRFFSVLKGHAMKAAPLVLISCLLMGLLSSCTTQNLVTKANNDKRNTKEELTAFSYNPAYEYTLQKGDKINLSVWDNDDMSVGSTYGIYNSNEVYGKWLMLDATGNVTVPKLGEVNLLGLTIPQTKEKLRNGFKQWIVAPIIEVKVLNKEVNILGELKAPGKYLLEKDNNTLLDVVAKAGDFDFYANKKEVQIVRMIDDKPVTLVVDLTKMDDYMAANVQIHPGDMIYVPSRKGKHWDRRAGSTIVPLTSVISTAVLVFGLIRR